MPYETSIKWTQMNTNRVETIYSKWFFSPPTPLPLLVWFIHPSHTLYLKQQWTQEKSIPVKRRGNTHRFALVIWIYADLFLKLFKNWFVCVHIRILPRRKPLRGFLSATIHVLTKANDGFMHIITYSLASPCPVISTARTVLLKMQRFVTDRRACSRYSEMRNRYLSMELNWTAYWIQYTQSWRTLRLVTLYLCVCV